MKTFIAASLLLAATASLSANPPQHGSLSGQQPPEPPSVEEMATHLLDTFDADQSGALDAGELIDALNWLRENRPPPPPRHERRG